MSEYIVQHSVARLIRSPPGYIGYDEGEQLIDAVLRQPYAVVLFDEIEKAHPHVLRVLLQIMDEGRLTDSKGRTVDFRNTIVILTSNIGAQHMTEGDGKETNFQLMNEVQRIFAPEFLNRLSSVVIFNSLGPNELEKIVHKSIQDVRQLLLSKGIRLVLETSGARVILAKSFDPKYGARPVERYIEATSTVVTTLSRMLLQEEITSGCVVHVEATEQSSSDDDTSRLQLAEKSPLQYRVGFDGVTSCDTIAKDIDAWRILKIFR
jgi:ATP-dependent Clp protease ATP-binding subunit ClpB